MKQTIKKVLFGLIPMFVLSCGSQPATEEKGKTKNESAESPAGSPSGISENRSAVKKEAVASWRVKTDNPLNDWYFSVQLFETPKTFHYLMKLEFEEITGMDTLKLPNFGIAPEPVIRKGEEKYAAIVGFLDKDKNFREYKKVYVVGDKLKVTALKHYGVSTSR